MTRIAAEKGVALRYRTHITTFDAACRFVQAGLAVAVLPIEVACRYTASYGLKAIPLEDAWATRRFIICCRRFDSLSIPAQRLLDHLLDCMLENMGYDTGIDLARLVAVRDILVRALPQEPLYGSIARVGIPATYPYQPEGC